MCYSATARLCLFTLYCYLLEFRSTNAKYSDNLVQLDRHVRAPAPTRSEGLGGFEPGDPAPAFQVRTLDGVYHFPQPDSKAALIIHAFTNKSAFLECLWTWNESLSDLLDHLPLSTEVLLMSLDDSAAQDAVWMREQVLGAAAHRGKEILSRLHFSPTPVWALGNWIPRVLYSWGCGGHNCGFAQVVFTASDWKLPLVSKRLNARYDWLSGRWGSDPYILSEAGNGCECNASVSGAVAWVSEDGCSFFTKVKTMSECNATGVLVYAAEGEPLRDMNCAGDECSTSLSIPASIVHTEHSVVQALREGHVVNVTFQTTPSPSFFFAIDQEGALSEMGWFLYPTFRFLAWQAEWFDFKQRLEERLKRPSHLVPVFERQLMQGETGAVSVVDLPTDLQQYDVLELDAALSCPGRRDETCAHWDHTVQLFVCCDRFSSYCDLELGRWITAFRRGTGHWLTDVSPLIPLLNDTRCSFSMKTVPWAMPWMTSLTLRFSHSNQTGNSSEGLQPFLVTPLFRGGTFDRNYNSRYQEINFTLPASTKKVELYAVITAHGSDENSCGEFCVTSHHFLINGVVNVSLLLEAAGSPLGCAMRVPDGAVPNEHGTWLYGRGGWCDGLQVDPWRTDVTAQLNTSGTNSVLYFGLFEGRNPNPQTDPGYIIMYSYLVFYK